jgi:hypothetical protein
MLPLSVRRNPRSEGLTTLYRGVSSSSSILSNWTFHIEGMEPHMS